jgi:hypothetical protein
MLDSIDKLSQTYGTAAGAGKPSKGGGKKHKLSKIDKMDAAIYQMIDPNKEKYRQRATSVIVALNVIIVLLAVVTKDLTLAIIVPAVWLLSPW